VYLHVSKVPSDKHLIDILIVDWLTDQYVLCRMAFQLTSLVFRRFLPSSRKSAVVSD